MAAQILGLGAFDRTNSAQIIGTGPGIRAVMGGASVTPAPTKFNLKFLWLQCSTNSGTWCIRQHKVSSNYWTKSKNLCCCGWCWCLGRVSKPPASTFRNAIELNFALVQNCTIRGSSVMESCDSNRSRCPGGKQICTIDGIRYTAI